MSKKVYGVSTFRMAPINDDVSAARAVEALSDLTEMLSHAADSLEYTRGPRDRQAIRVLAQDVSALAWGIRMWLEKKQESEFECDSAEREAIDILTLVVDDEHAMNCRGGLRLLLSSLESYSDRRSA